MSDSISIRYQPIVDLSTMRVDSVEVLVRAVSPDGVVIGPESIVEAMTGSEESMALTGSILRRAMAEYVEHDFGNLDLGVGFNLPLDAMLHPDLVVIVEMIRNQAGLPARSIHFELTEHHPVHDIARAGAVITVLRQAGYGMALDDIIPDMTNLDALLDLPIRVLKLDRSITTSIKPEDHGFIRRIVAHAGANQQDVIAEGIETLETLERVRGLGVTHGQGFYFAKPLPAEELQPFLIGWAKGKSA